MRSLTALFVLLGAFSILSVLPVMANDGATHDGVVVSAGMGKLVMKDDQGKQHSHDVNETVKVTVNGKLGKLEDLTMGMKIRVFLDSDGQVLSISTIDAEK